MLNKLSYYRSLSQRQKDCAYLPQAAGLRPAENDSANMLVLQKYYTEQGLNVALEPVHGGTLGISFLCRTNGNSTKFIKTHSAGTIYQTALRNEYQLLKVANQGLLSVEQFTWKNQLYLSMDHLFPCEEILPDAAFLLIQTFAAKLRLTELDLQMYSIRELYHESRIELAQLNQHGFFTREFSAQLEKRLDFLGRELPNLSPRICHGDFGDRNIMVNDSGQLVVIDWEDAFQGVDGYDYLYWLTFFNHRKFYCRDVFCRSGIHPDLAAAVLVMILMIKSAISFYSGEYLHNSMTVQDRISEILAILEGTI